MRWLFSLALCAVGALSLAQPGQITINHDVSTNVVFSIMLQENADKMGGGSSFPYSFSGQGSFQNPFPQTVDVGKLTMIGLTEDQGGVGVAAPSVNVMLRWAAGVEFVGMEWEEVFSGPTEAEIIDALFAVQAGESEESLNAGMNVIGQWFGNNIDLFSNNGENAVFLNFSQGKNVGTGNWVQNPVPEPSALLVLGTGAAIAFLRRRKAA